MSPKLNTDGAGLTTNLFLWRATSAEMSPDINRKGLIVTLLHSQSTFHSIAPKISSHTPDSFEPEHRGSEQDIPVLKCYNNSSQF